MTTTIEILYADLTRQKETLEDVAKLKHHDVLFMIAKDEEIEGKQGNIDSAFGSDWYALCEKRDGGQTWIAILPFDNGYFVWRQTNCSGCKGREEVHIPLAPMHTIFQGAKVDEKTWEKAERIFNEEMI